MTEILAIIPARGGSKGIPRKNIRPFSGYPLIAWSIAAAKQSKLVTRVIVSTDDEEIAEVAREFGAETPFLRPAEFAQDNTTDLPVFQHALKWLEEKRRLPAGCRCATATDLAHPTGGTGGPGDRGAAGARGCGQRARCGAGGTEPAQDVAAAGRRTIPDEKPAEGGRDRGALQRAAAEPAAGLLADRSHRRDPDRDHPERVDEREEHLPAGDRSALHGGHRQPAGLGALRTPGGDRETGHGLGGTGAATDAGDGQADRVGL